MIGLISCQLVIVDEGARERRWTLISLYKMYLVVACLHVQLSNSAQTHRPNSIIILPCANHHVFHALLSRY